MSDYVSVELRRQVRAHFSNRCAYCQSSEALTVVTFEVEHIIPNSLGGLTQFENLCLACPTCNRHKSNRIVGLTDIGNATINLLRMNRSQLVEVRSLWGIVGKHPPN